MTVESKPEEAPFEIYTLAHVSRMGGQTANTLRELARGVETCSDESIYHHTIVAMRNQLALTDNVTNDYARWAHTSLRQEELAAHLAMTDIRDCQTIGDLRRTLSEILRAFMEARPEEVDRPADNPFYFCEGMEVAVPLTASARTLEEFRECVKEMSGESFYLHFVAPRTRHEARTNDFSVWLDKSLGLRDLAKKINEIDVMENTLDGAREKILELVDAEREARLKVAAANN